MQICKVFHTHTYVRVTYTIPTHYIYPQTTNKSLTFNKLPFKNDFFFTFQMNSNC